AHGADESATLHVTPPDRRHGPALQTQIWNLSQGFVKVKAVMGGSNFVSRDVVAELGIVSRVRPIPRQVFARQLPLDQFGILGEKENSPLETDFVRALFDGAFEKRVDHG